MSKHQALIRVTAKLRTERGIKIADLVQGEPPFGFLGGWHANLIYIRRKKCLVFVNDKTRFSFIEPDVSRQNIREHFQIMFENVLSSTLMEEGFSAEARDRAVAEYAHIGYGASNDRSVLGTLNEVACFYESGILDAGSLHSPNISTLIRKVNRTPMKPLGYRSPIDCICELFGQNRLEMDWERAF